MPRSSGGGSKFSSFSNFSLGSGSSSRSGGGGGGFFNRSPARTSAPAARPPVMHHQQQRAQQPAPQMQQRPMLGGGGGLGSALATGMAMGAGSAIAHEAIRGVMGSGSGHGGQQHMAP